MGVRARGSTYQVDFVYKGQRVRKDGFKTTEEGEQWERDERSRLRSGLKHQTSAAILAGERCDTLEELYQRTYEMHWQGSKSEETAVANAATCLEHLGRDKHPSSVTTRAVDQMIGTLKGDGLSGGTINRKLAALSKMLRFGHQRGWVAVLPHIQRQKEAEHRIRWLSDDEEKRILTWFRNTSMQDMQDLALILVDSGLRLSEALHLAWADVADGWIHVRVSKNGKPRRVPFTSRLRDTLAERHKRNGEAEPMVFPALTVNLAEKAWTKMRENIGLDKDPQFVMHMLRHTFCSRLAQRGIQLHTIQQLAGHKTIAMTMRYAHLCPDNLQAAIGVL